MPRRRSREHVTPHLRNRLLKVNFEQLAQVHPELNPFLINGKHLDEGNPDAVKELTRVLFKHFYNLEWSLPPGHLVPPLPGRLNYIHAVADLFLEPGVPDHQAYLRSLPVTLFDIGLGANCVYPLLTVAEYGWSVIGSDTDPDAVSHAQHLVTNNGLQDKITVSLQTDRSSYLRHIQPLTEREAHVCVCNPPFYASEAEALQSHPKRRRVGTRHELVTEHGDLDFILGMVRESKAIHDEHNSIGPLRAPPPNELIYYTCLVPRKETLKTLEAHLRTGFKAPYHTSLTLTQGKLTRWVIVWSWLPDAERRDRISKLREARSEATGSRTASRSCEQPPLRAQSADEAAKPPEPVSPETHSPTKVAATSS